MHSQRLHGVSGNLFGTLKERYHSATHTSRIICATIFVLLLLGILGWLDLATASFKALKHACTTSIYFGKKTNVSPKIIPGAASPFECLQKSGFEWRPFGSNSTWEILAIPEFRTSPSGFQRRCSLVIGSRQTLYKNLPYNVAWGDITRQPRTIFVRTDLVQAFYHRVLPCISVPFVLLTGDHDATIPRQIDQRFEKYLSRKIWDALLRDRRIVHMFIENLDAYAPKVSSLPVGINSAEFPGRDADYIVQHVDISLGILNRPLKALQVDRLRLGPQWEDRARVGDMCLTAWSEFCDSTSTLPGLDFWKLVRSYSFVLCVHGGGVDPNPKAWEALLMGAIPVIQHFPGYASYEGLPVVFGDYWSSDVLSMESMESWRQQLSPYFTDPAKRAEVIRRLKSDFWWDNVEAALQGRLESFQESVTKIAIHWRPGPESGNSTIL